MTDNFIRNIVVSLCFLIVLLFHKKTLPCPPHSIFLRIYFLNMSPGENAGNDISETEIY